MVNDSQKRSWFKWTVGTIIALIAAGSGLVAVMKYVDSNREADELKRIQSEQRFRQELAEWEKFSPKSISLGTQEKELRGMDRFDLETGRATSNPGSDTSWDLMFGCWPNNEESLRASKEVEWAHIGVVDFASVSYRDIRDAEYKRKASGYNDLYMAHKSNVPGKGYTFAIKTTANNVAKVQILSYKLVDSNPQVCRNIFIRYEVYPIVADLPKPRRQ